MLVWSEEAVGRVLWAASFPKGEASTGTAEVTRGGGGEGGGRFGSDDII